MPDLNLSHTVSDDGNTLKIAATGRLAIDTVQPLQSLLMELIAPVSSIQLDLSAIDGIDLAGVQLICSACRTALDAHKRFNFTGSLAADVTKAIGDSGLQRQATCRHNDNLPCIWCGGIN